MNDAAIYVLRNPEPRPAEEVEELRAAVEHAEGVPQF
jgi:hypothetical protein